MTTILVGDFITTIDQLKGEVVNIEAACIIEKDDDGETRSVDNSVVYTIEEDNGDIVYVNKSDIYSIQISTEDGDVCKYL